MLTGTIFVSAQERATDSDFLSKVTIRPTAGLNIASESSGGTTSDALVSFKAGAIADYAFREDWGFRAGLLITGQGGKYGADVNDWISFSVEATDNPWYLELPLDVYYNYRFKEITFTGFTGFPLSFGLFGNYKQGGEGHSGGVSVGGSKHSAFDDLNRFALSYNIGLEATWRRMTLGFEYSRHLTNDAKNGSGHLQVFSINLGYNFKL